MTDGMHVSERFLALVHRWRLSREESLSLLGLSYLSSWSDDKEARFVLVRLEADAEARMRLLVEVDGHLRALLGCEEDIPKWLRSQDVGFVDPGVTPLRAMCAGRADIRQLRNVLREMRPSTACRLS